MGLGTYVRTMEDGKTGEHAHTPYESYDRPPLTPPRWDLSMPPPPVPSHTNSSASAVPSLAPASDPEAHRPHGDYAPLRPHTGGGWCLGGPKLTVAKSRPRPSGPALILSGRDEMPLPARGGSASRLFYGPSRRPRTSRGPVYSRGVALHVTRAGGPKLKVAKACRQPSGPALKASGRGNRPLPTRGALASQHSYCRSNID